MIVMLILFIVRFLNLFLICLGLIFIVFVNFLVACQKPDREL